MNNHNEQEGSDAAGFSGIGRSHLSAEDFLKMFILNPLRMKTTIRRIMNSRHSRITFIRREGSRISREGFVEDIDEETNCVLDDGTSSCGIVVCQTCGRTISHKNLKRCICGRTCCICHGCGVFFSGKWYCSRMHAFLDTMGLPLR